MSKLTKKKNNFASKKANLQPPRKKKIEAKTGVIDPQQALLIRLKKGKSITEKEKQDIIKSHNSLVQAIVANIVASGKVPPNLHFNDLINYGIEGLVKAWANFDIGRGIQFKVYASYRIRGEILDRIRKEWKYQNPGGYKSIYGKLEKNVAQAVTDSKKNTTESSEEEKVREVVVNSAMAYLLSYEEVTEESPTGMANDPGEDVVNQIDFANERGLLWDAVKTLADDEKKIIKGYYIEDKTQNDISRELGYSKSKISRMHNSVLRKLRQRLNKKIKRD